MNCTQLRLQLEQVIIFIIQVKISHGINRNEEKWSVKMETDYFKISF